MDFDLIFERWIPLILVSFLFFKVVQAVLGSLFRSVLSPKVVVVLAFLMLFGILPIPLVRDVMVGTLVFCFSAVREAYAIVMDGMGVRT